MKKSEEIATAVDEFAEQQKKTVKSGIELVEDVGALIKCAKKIKNLVSPSKKKKDELNKNE